MPLLTAVYGSSDPHSPPPLPPLGRSLRSPDIRTGSAAPSGHCPLAVPEAGPGHGQQDSLGKQGGGLFPPPSGIWRRGQERAYPATALHRKQLTAAAVGVSRPCCSLEGLEGKITPLQQQARNAWKTLAWVHGTGREEFNPLPGQFTPGLRLWSSQWKNVGHAGGTVEGACSLPGPVAPACPCSSREPNPESMLRCWGTLI